MNKKYPQSNQKGFASIVIAFVLIIVMSLMTVGFTQLARREQQSALDRQLAKQAYYAAESGINDAYADIKSGKINTSTSKANGGSQCILPGDVPVSARTHNQTIDDNNSVYYACLLIDLTPRELIKDLDRNEAWTTTFSTNASIDTIKVSWTSRDDQNTPRASANGFTPDTSSGGWGPSPAVLEFTLTPLTTLTRDALISASSTSYLYPTNNLSTPAAADYTTGSTQGKIIGRCTSGTCTATIQNIPSSTGPFLMRIVNYYDKSHIVVSATGAGFARDFVNAQARIDVTGKAKNVLKRIQVSTPLNSPLDLPSFALEAGDICKREQTEPAGTEFINPDNTTASSNPCKLDL